MQKVCECFFNIIICVKKYDSLIKGQIHWSEQRDICLRKYKTPIDIHLLEAKQIRLPPLKFNETTYRSTIKNNGYTGELRINLSIDVMLLCLLPSVMQIAFG